MKQKRTAVLVSTVLAMGVGLGWSLPSALATPSSGVTTPLLEHALFDAMNVHAHSTPAHNWGADIQTRGQTDLYVVENQFVPGGTTGWHSHPGPSLIMVVSGSVTNYSSDNCSGQTFNTGQSFIDPSDTVHMVVNNGTVTAKTIAVQFIPQGDTRKDDAPPAC